MQTHTLFYRAWSNYCSRVTLRTSCNDDRKNRMRRPVICALRLNPQRMRYYVTAYTVILSSSSRGATTFDTVCRRQEKPFSTFRSPSPPPPPWNRDRLPQYDQNNHDLLPGKVMKTTRWRLWRSRFSHFVDRFVTMLWSRGDVSSSDRIHGGRSEWFSLALKMYVYWYVLTYRVRDLRVTARQVRSSSIMSLIIVQQKYW